MNENKKMLHAALRYATLGYPVFPCSPGKKTPITSHGFKDATTDAALIEQWWERHPSANIGMPTAGLLVIDVDGADNPWPNDPGLAEEIACSPIALTPRGGRHHIFRQPAGKNWKNTAGKIADHVDTRANGGYIVVAPSVVNGKSYRWAETFELGVAPEELPEPPAWIVTKLDGDGLFTRPMPPRDGATLPASDTPNEEAPKGNAIPSGQRNDALARLAGAMRRVGMSRDEILAALVQVNIDRCSPSLPSREVEKIASSICRYEPDQISVAVAENHWMQDQITQEDGRDIEDASPKRDTIGAMPRELLRVPGFVSEVMDHTMNIAPYPSLEMAFGGALALQATLAGRKVRDSGDNRTNLYLLALAYSSVGKNKPRQVNDEILREAGSHGCVGGRFASGEGIEDALIINPSMIFQTDEIDSMLQSINKSKDARHEQIMATLLTMYSSANSAHPMRRKAGKESSGVIDQPHLVVFGTAIPNHYYGALSERMLTNGFFARMIILECEKRVAGQEPKLDPIPSRVMETARWWGDFSPGAGNLDKWHPVPKIVPHTEEAVKLLIEMRLESEAEYGKAEDARDPVGTTVWGRVSEHVRKMALVYAVSENYRQPEIGKDAVQWAWQFIMHQTRRMLYMAGCHVADNPFQAECLKFIQLLREAPNCELPHSTMLRRMKMDARSFYELTVTMEQRGEIQISIVPRAKGMHGGKPQKMYRIMG